MIIMVIYAWVITEKQLIFYYAGSKSHFQIYLSGFES